MTTAPHYLDDDYEAPYITGNYPDDEEEGEGIERPLPFIKEYLKKVEYNDEGIPLWTTAKGEKLPITEMKNGHLLNAIKLSARIAAGRIVYEELSLLRPGVPDEVIDETLGGPDLDTDFWSSYALPVVPKMIELYHRRHLGEDLLPMLNEHAKQAYLTLSLRVLTEMTKKITGTRCSCDCHNKGG